MRHCIAPLLYALLVPEPALSQSRVGLTLTDVVNAALRSSPAVQAAREQVRASRGRVLAARGPFDPLVGVNMTTAQTTQRSLDAAAPAGTVTLPTSTVGYGVSLSKQLQSGIVINPTVSVQRTAGDGLPLPTSEAHVSLTVSIPILKNRFGTVTAAPLRAAEALYGADGAALQESAAAGVYDAVSAYWAYAAAQENLEIRMATEARAELLVGEIEVLVRAEERAASDLNQAVGNLASKRVTRMVAEQALAEAHERLALSIGADPANVPLLPDTGIAFPEPPASVSLSDSAADAAFVTTALARRPELARERAIRSSVAIAVRAAAAAARPQLDLLFGVGYAGLETSGGFAGLVAPLYREIPGVNASVRINYQLPWSNVAAAGGVVQQDAALRQAEVEIERLRREAILGARVAALATRRDALVVREAAAAVEQYRAVAESEKEKNRLALNSLLEVILAEDALTNARLADVASRATYAAALVTLRYETGTLVDRSGAELSVSVDKLLTSK